MPKKIILLSDGTGNSSHDPFKTNVWRLYQALDLTQDDQIACYDDGVGTSSFQPLALLGGAVGWGLKRNVLDLYTFLCRNYEPGAEIYCFGFSRGAFTVRVLVGLITNQGLVPMRYNTATGKVQETSETDLQSGRQGKTDELVSGKDQETSEADLQRLAKAAFRAYRACYHEDRKLLNPFNLLGKLLRSGRDGIVWALDKMRGRTHYDEVPKLHTEVKFVGVFDTVAAYGLPVDELTQAWDFIFPLSFPNNKLSPQVERACHALALDDERHSFHPELWDENVKRAAAAEKEYLEKYPEKKLKPLQERLLQVWFAGMHSDVGGSYPDDAMSFVPLEWMLEQAEAKGTGLRFHADAQKAIRAAANLRGPMHDSRRGTGGLYRYRPRKLAELIDDKEREIEVPLPKIHESVFARIQQGTDSYAPIVLPEFYEVYTRNGQLLRSGSAAAGQNTIQLETPVQAKERTQQQEHMWNLVWWKRVVYFLTVAAAFALLLFPLYRPATAACTGPFCFAAPIVSSLGMVLPGFVAPLLKAYESHPGSFALALAAFILLLRQGNELQRRIFDGMRRVWQGNPLSGQEFEPANWLYRLRASERYRSFMKTLTKRFWIPLVTVLTVWFLLTGITHFSFTMLESAGGVCRKSQGGPQDFENTSLCWASGQHVVEGNRYKLTLVKKPETPWKDGDDISSEIGGYNVDKLGWRHKLILYSGVLLRRHLSEPWFKPIARIGELGHDEYPLTSKGSAEPNKLVAEITARRTGELFLFLNDAALPVPEKWQSFYKNNIGTATVTLELLDEEAESSTGKATVQSAQPNQSSVSGQPAPSGTN